MMEIIFKIIVAILFLIAAFITTTTFSCVLYGISCGIWIVNVIVTIAVKYK